MQTGNLGGPRYDPSGRWLAGHSNIGGIPAIKLWDLNAPADLEPLPLVKADEAFINSVAFQVVKAFREKWLAATPGVDHYRNPGPIRFTGKTEEGRPITLVLNALKE